MPPKPKKVEDMSVRELKAELKQYGVDFQAAGCVEKKDMKELLKKTRAKQGYPPKKSGASETASNASSTSSSSPFGFASGFFTASSTGASGAARINPNKQSVPANKKVAILFEPDNDSVQEAAQFIQPFFSNTPECVGSRGGGNVPNIAWVLPSGMREDLIRSKLPDQLGHFEWFRALFVEDNGTVTDFDSEPVSLGDSKEDDSQLQGVNLYADVARRWGADWIVIRCSGGVLPRQWLSVLQGVFTHKKYCAAKAPAIFAIDTKWHVKNVIGGAKKGVVAPYALQPHDAWYYWLLNVYPESILYEMDEPDQEEKDDDADRVIVLCEEDQFKATNQALSKLKKK